MLEGMEDDKFIANDMLTSNIGDASSVKLNGPGLDVTLAQEPEITVVLNKDEPILVESLTIYSKVTFLKFF